MRNEDLTDLLSSYLRSPDAEKSNCLKILSQHPDDALSAILGFHGPYPESIDPRDAHDRYLVDVLGELLKKSPRLFGKTNTKGSASYLLISAAILTREPCFVDGILAGLRDRSLYTKLMVVDAISQHRYLRTAAAEMELKRLLSLQSIASSSSDRRKIESALAAFTKDA